MLTLLNTFVFVSPAFGVLSLVFFLLSAGSLLGTRLFRDVPSVLSGTLGILTILVSWSIVGSAIYYTMPIDKPALAVLLFVTGMVIFALDVPASAKKIAIHKPSFTIFAGIVGITIALIAWWNTLLPLATTEAVRTPWAVVTPAILLALLLACVLLFALYTKRITTTIFLATVAVLFSALALTVSLYPIGFGFDPFIHRATVAHIVSFGTIHPKPLYYIGQYALELIGVHLFSLPLALLDRLLVPLLAALFLPAAAWFAAEKTRQSSVFLVSLFLLPLSAFILTTPQGLSYLYIATLFFLSVPHLFDEEEPPWIVLVLLTLAALITHPLAGIPALIYLALLFTATYKGPHPYMNIATTVTLALVSCFTMPIVFMVQAQQSGLNIHFTLVHLFDAHLLELTGFFDNRFAPLLDGAYLFIDNQLWVLFTLAVIASVFFIRKRLPFSIHVPLIASAVFFVNYWLLSTALQFDFLIEYERQNYSVRMLTLAMLVCAIPVGLLIAHLVKTRAGRPRFLQTSGIVLAALLATANVYGAYPRHDNYARSAGFNVSVNDQDAVLYIHDTAGDEPYIVLANQAVSAAALDLYGFQTYYHDDIFYYPIPTGGPLYQLYLKTTDHPDRQTIEEAMDLAGVNHAYFVMNDYWFDADKIIESAKQTADHWFAVDGGAVTIFEYQR